MPARSPAALALAAALLAIPSAEAADPRAVLLRAKAATGGDRWDDVATLHARWKVRSGGLDGREETWHDVRRGRWARQLRLGPARFGAGFDGERVWSHDDSGHVRPEEGADAREGAANDAYRAALGYWFPERWPATIEDAGERREGERAFSVVRVTPRGGRPYELWVDAATGRFDRWTERDATRLRTVHLSDYRQVGGVWLPHAVRSTTGDAKYDDHYTLEHAALGESIADERFAPPPPPPADFAIADGRAATTVPFQLANHHIYVDVRLNGKGPFRLLADTGGSNIVTPALARELGLETAGALEGRGVGERSEDVALTRVGTVELGEASLKDQLFAVFPLAGLDAAEGVEVQGLIGYEVFKRFVVTIDYAARRLTLHDPRAFRPDGRGVAVPFTFDGHVPQVDGTLDGIAGKFWIDTGSRASLSVFRPFADRHGLVERYAARLEAVTGWGIGGPARALLARARRLTLGDVVVERPVIDISVRTEGTTDDRYGAGNVGGVILKRFTVTFDYGTQRIFFAPNAAAREPEPHDRAGLWLNAAGGAFEVMDVVAGGPAAKAGVRVGDRVVAVDGTPAAKLGLPDLRERLRTSRPGTKVRLTLESAGTRRDVTVALADLV
jgi:hypothetical protein